VTAARDYSDLHELIDRLEPEQAAEVKEHALRLGGGYVLRSWCGPGGVGDVVAGAGGDAAGRAEMVDAQPGDHRGVTTGHHRDQRGQTA